MSVELYGRPAPEETPEGVRREIDVVPGKTAHPFTVVAEVQCRRCQWCLRQRSRLWRDRARREIAHSVRTWFGTLTLSPEEHYIALSKARARAARQGDDFDALEEGERFARLHREVGPLITKWMKRVREESGARLRYLLVAEAHKSGLPHYHVLIHELSDLTPVRKEVLKSQWHHGFTRWKLVDEGPAAAGYVCKYLAKSALARVRASLRYGEVTQTGSPHSCEAT